MELCIERGDVNNDQQKCWMELKRGAGCFEIYYKKIKKVHRLWRTFL